MKKFQIKGAAKNLHPDALLILFAVFTLILTAIRAYQLMYIFEPDTGFYFIEVKDSISIPLLYVGAALAAVVFLLFSQLSGKMPEGRAPEGKNALLGAGSLLLSLAQVVDAVHRFSDVFTFYDAGTETFKTYLTRTRTFPALFEMAFALLAALYFLVVAVSYFSGKKSYQRVKILSVTPVLWMVFRLVGRFIRAQSFIHLSELFWEIACSVFMMIFFLQLCRILSDVDGADKMRFTFGTGLCGATLALMLFFSRTVTYVFAGADYLSESSPIEFCDFACGLFVLLFLLSCTHDLSVKEKAKAPAAAAPPAPLRPASNAEEDEAFRIADEYSNRYMRSDPAVIPSAVGGEATSIASVLKEDAAAIPAAAEEAVEVIPAAEAEAAVSAVEETQE